MKIPTIRQLPSGSYFCQLRINGQSISITEDTYDLVYAKAAAYKAGLLKAKKKPEDITLRQACTRKIESLKSRLSPSTIQGYERIVDGRFQNLMDTKLSKIDASVIDRALEEECSLTTRLGGKVSPKTIKNAYAFIAPILRSYGCEIGNPTLPEVKRKIPLIIPAETLIPIIIGSDIELPCLLAAWLSLSMSEILGLTKSKSIRNGQLYIAETVVRVHNEQVRKSGGKEVERSRVLDIPGHINRLIDQVDGDVIVPLTDNALHKRFKKLLADNNLPEMTFHQLRHLNASVMAMLGIPEKEAQERGGWKTPHTMKMVYTHTFTEQRKLADQKVNAFFESIIANENAN